MDAAEILERAADVIDERGHCKGHYAISFSGPSPVCAIGAIRVALFGTAYPFHPTPDCNEGADALVDAVEDIAPWNDAPERTKDEVTSTMRAVAATLRASAVTPETVTA